MGSTDPHSTRDRRIIVAAARAWIGTPYHHQASSLGLGCDCLGLVRGVWRTVVGPEPEAAPAYSGDWGQADGRETMLDAARRHFLEIDPAEAATADVLLFRWRAGLVAKHAGILSGPATMIHAAEGIGVVEVPISPWWRRRVAAAFSFPDPV